MERVLCCAVLALAASASATAANTTTTTTTPGPTTIVPATTTIAVPTIAAATTTTTASTTTAAAAAEHAAPDSDASASTSVTSWSRSGRPTGRTGRSNGLDIDDNSLVANQGGQNIYQGGGFQGLQGPQGGQGQGQGQGQGEDNDDSEPYAFDYSVRDPSTGDTKSQWESRVDGVVRGMYSLLQPDGSLRSVSYTADNQNGFRAVVKLDNPGLPTGPARPGSLGVPTSSVSSSVSSSAILGATGRAPPSRPSPPATRPTHFRFSSRPASSSSAGAGSSTAPPAATTTTTTAAQPGAPGAGAASSTGASSASTSTVEPESGEVGAPQALRASPLETAGGDGGDDDTWQAILGSTSARPEQDVGQLYGEHEFPPGPASSWLHDTLGAQDPSSSLLLAGPEHREPASPAQHQVQHPPVRLPLEYEVQPGPGHFLFADPGDHDHQGLQEAADGSMRQLMRRQRARKRHVVHHGDAVGHPALLRVRHLRQHHPTRWTWVSANQ
ncbi:Cuticle protein 19 [Frankliniella fusca]|uniref:Cuticle protein 19 n=1 Tax=Frankliniella fusca TaxID=407009 RepID=A0AAE1L8H4_9NEOP|nr:Cuticle protein 19 [Frankliniella fusca]